jgi:glycosyltransferase involved in cell wall biosynthesis
LNQLTTDLAKARKTIKAQTKELSKERLQIQELRCLQQETQETLSKEKRESSSSSKKLESALSHIKFLETELKEHQTQLTGIARSRSWRLTAPLRVIDENISRFPSLLRGQIPKPKIKNPELIAEGKLKSAENTQRKLPITALVITWDVGHNPLGRSYMLAEVLDRIVRNVVIIGFQFPRYGDSIWEPLKNSKIPVISYPGGNLPEFLESLERISERLNPDIVFACKARLPSLQLGLYIRQRTGCPLVCDVDDHELTFFSNAKKIPLKKLGEMGEGSAKKNREPYDSLWTGVSQSLCKLADHLLVSNESLQQEFGGTILPHVRDERRFDPQRFDGSVIRREFDIPQDAKVLLFYGTPRQHKGIDQLAESIKNVSDEKALLVIVGDAPDKRDINRVSQIAGDRVRFIGNQPFERSPEILSMADAVCLLQDTSHPVSQYQLPAKAIDAVAMGIPLMITKTPSTRKLIERGLAVEVKPKTLVATLERVFRGKDPGLPPAGRRQKLFDRHYSYASAADGLYRLITDLTSKTAGDRKANIDFERFVDAQKSVLGVRQATSESPRSDGKDVVLFWKQNDTTLYGRRVDMLVKYLASRSDIRRVLVFDAPISESDVVQFRQTGSLGPTQHRWIYQRTYEKLLGKLDSEKVSYHVFLHPPGIYDLPGRQTGRRTPLSDGFLPFIENVLDKEGVNPSESLFFIYPKFFLGEDIIARFNPGRVIVDVVDDHRAWPGISEQERDQITENYEKLLARADMAFVNCQPMFEKMRSLTRDLRLVPNGCDLSPTITEPVHNEGYRELKHWKGKVIGFTGNLEAKIDIELIHKLANRFSDCRIVLVGSTHANRSAAGLAALPNVIMPGVAPYQEVGAWIKRFDVAIVPHLRTEMTINMNPLKIYAYLQWRTPIVATEIANIEYQGPMLRIANSHDRFLQNVAQILESPVNIDGELQDFLAENDWKARFATQITELIDSMP